uniref:Uncharacterized protein n=1 Tax=Anguilla anguilla TaxID=7936 RepID=A0A0E9VNE1_ANGAN
MDGLMDFSSHG